MEGFAALSTGHPARTAPTQLRRATLRIKQFVNPARLPARVVRAVLLLLLLLLLLLRLTAR